MCLFSNLLSLSARGAQKFARRRWGIRNSEGDFGAPEIDEAQRLSFELRARTLRGLEMQIYHSQRAPLVPFSRRPGPGPGLGLTEIVANFGGQS